jgi:hypothetical protein
MEAKIKHCIINCGVNGWYPHGTKRLERSLIYHGFNGDIITWPGGYPPNSPTHEEHPYAMKIYAFEEAINRGYTHILWLDCSVWAIKDPNPIFDVINHDGYYLWDSGFPVGETCNDFCLNWYGVSRDTAMGVKDISTSMVGVNLSNPVGRGFYKQWKESMLAGCFRGSREYNPEESRDPRFKFHRQDQSGASLAAFKMGMRIHEPGIYSSYYKPEMPESVIFTMRGM